MSGFDVRFETNADKVASDIKQFGHRFDPNGPNVKAFMLSRGQWQRKTILDRCARGQDVDGNTFAAYSSRYIEILKKVPHPLNVDLARSGDMLASVQPYWIGGGVIHIDVGGGGFSRTELNKAKFHHRIPRGKPRKFMGISSSDQKAHLDDFRLWRAEQAKGW